VVVIIQEYDFKRGFKKDSLKRVRDALKSCFETGITEQGGSTFVLSYGSLRTMTVKVGEKLFVDSEADLNVTEDIMVDTNRRFREFLWLATGYTAKQRAKKAQESIKGKD
jgi:hypothetical protein